MADPGLIRTRTTKDRKRRAKLRTKLRTEGINEQLIAKIVEQQRHEDLVVRHGLETARQIRGSSAGTLANQPPDDHGYKPTVADPLLKGPARVTGIAAKTVRRRNTITRFQYDALERAEP